MNTTKLAALLLAGVGLACQPAEPPAGGAAAGWPSWGGPAEGTRYSPLADITRANVGALERAWVHHSGDVAPGELRTAYQATPVLHGSALYFCSPFNRVFRIDAESGEQHWVFDPQIEHSSKSGLTCRGVAVWEDPDAPPDAICAVRVFTGTVDVRLIALDAATGLPCPGFGDAGHVDLRRGLGEMVPGEVKLTSPPVLVRDTVTVGHQVLDNRRIDAPGGVVRGFDARSGALRWAFDPVPPGTPPLPEDADGARFHRGTPNAWAVFSADEARDLVFVPTGNPSNDFYRGGREDIDHYGSSVIALRGRTGEVVWSFQTVHHDLWDYDVASQPTLVDLEVEGTSVPAVIQPTKIGHVFVLHRETGEPLFPVEERPVAQSEAPGERSAPTQPFPTVPAPLHPGGLDEADVFGLTPIDRADCRARLRALRNEGSFTPPSLAGSLQYPGVAGGANWGSAAFDPERGRLVLLQTRLGTVHRLVPRAEAETTPRSPPREILFPQAGTPYALLQSVFLSSWGIPCSPPPWAEIVAVDLPSGEVAWREPFGTTRGQAPWPFWLRWGVPGMGGPILTGGGLVFVGAAMDGYLRAIDTATGEELWRDALPAGGQATPLTYRVREGGRQFVVIAAGGHSTLGTELGDALVAYALPRPE
jgi:quinoprotein glucose dehydrogenase